jgi:hypothetical protein
MGRRRINAVKDNKMIKAKAKSPEGKEILLFGLSEENITRLRMQQPIIVIGEEMGVPNFDIIIMWGQTEDDIIAELSAANMVSSETKVNDDRESNDSV